MQLYPNFDFEILFKCPGPVRLEASVELSEAERRVRPLTRLRVILTLDCVDRDDAMVDYF